MSPKDKARSLVDKFKDYVNPYIGSSMLSNTEDKDAILWQSKKCAIVVVDEILEVCRGQYIIDIQNGYIDGEAAFWIEVKQEIEKL